MRILLTGATGRVGSRLLPRLIESGHQVRVLLRKPQTNPHSSATVVTGDLLAPATLIAATTDIDAVVHLAAFFRGQDAERINSVNIEGTRNLAEAVLQSSPGARLILASTSLVYNNLTCPGTEDQPVIPAAPYPASKVAAEEHLLALHKSDGMDVRIMRLGFVYGDNDPHLDEATPLFERWDWHPADRLHLVHHADVAQAVELLLATTDLADGIFNVADDSPVTIQEILELTGGSASLGDPSAPLTTPWRNLLNTTRLRSLGFRPHYPSLFAAQALDAL